MMVPLYVLLSVLPVLFRFMGLEVGCVSLPRPDISAMALVLNNTIDRAGIPDLVTKFGFPSILGKKVSNLSTGPTVDIQVIDMRAARGGTYARRL